MAAAWPAVSSWAGTPPRLPEVPALVPPALALLALRLRPRPEEPLDDHASEDVGGCSKVET